MIKNAIQVEHIYKQYRLGVVSTGTISHDLNRWWHKIQGKEDPYQLVTAVNDRSKKTDQNYVWALNDVTFNVEQGKVLGIIGKNGAGKSTLLKILSKVTSPTKGSISVDGRIASLLEVGTGFHPELSGRENIFLNGAILGMTKSEIKRKFDEIVDFSGVESYIDTPVKRYSSGMYVRLAFAVAAHLESEILIVDEVLAVGDAEFQKKCLGKMKDVSKGEGRTVLFVSHNMTAVNSLCTDCVYMKNGSINSIGTTSDIVDEYLRTEYHSKTAIDFVNTPKHGDEVAHLIAARIVDQNSRNIEFSQIHEPLGIEFTYEVLLDGFCPVPNIHVYTSTGICAFISTAPIHDGLSKKGIHTATMWIPSDFLNDETYIVHLALSTLKPIRIHFYVLEALIFDVIEDLGRREGDYSKKIHGVVRPKLNWIAN